MRSLPGTSKNHRLDAWSAAIIVTTLRPRRQPRVIAEDIITPFRPRRSTDTRSFVSK
jgi:hypothetical protein